MDDQYRLACLLVNVIFLVAWGAYERLSAIITARKHASPNDTDRGSLFILYATILLGYGVGIPAAFTGYGRIDRFFPYLSLTGFIIIALGLAIRLLAKKTLREHFTYTVKIIENHALITDGMYHYIRHPSYLGQSLIFLGSGIAFSNWISLIFLFIPNFVAGLYRISVEEQALVGHFRDRYTDYMKRTKKLIPWVF